MKFSFNDEDNKDRLDQQKCSFLYFSRHFHSRLYGLFQDHNLRIYLFRVWILCVWIFTFFLWVILRATLVFFPIYSSSLFLSHSHSLISHWSCEIAWLDFCFKLSLNLISHHNGTLSFFYVNCFAIMWLKSCIFIFIMLCSESKASFGP